MYESCWEEQDKEATKYAVSVELCETMARYCKGFIPSGIDLNEIVSDEAITIIIRKKYCKNGKEQRITVEPEDEDTPIKMMDVLMHMILHHKHISHKYWEGLTRYSDKSDDYEELPEGEYLTQWGC
jgi:hypothetical protein